MNNKQIEDLLRRFMDGMTTEAEESLLAGYFSSEDSIPDELKTYQLLFQSFNADAYKFSQEELDNMCADDDTVGKYLRPLEFALYQKLRPSHLRVAVSVAITVGIGFAAYLQFAGTSTGGDEHKVRLAALKHEATGADTTERKQNADKEAIQLIAWQMRKTEMSAVKNRKGSSCKLQTPTVVYDKEDMTARTNPETVSIPSASPEYDSSVTDIDNVLEQFASLERLANDGCDSGNVCSNTADADNGENTQMSTSSPFFANVDVFNIHEQTSLYNTSDNN